MTDLWEKENEIYAEGYETLCGVDEAGRGPLAGPVYAAAVILPRGLEIPGLNDSKKLSEKKREALYDQICARALAWSVAFATVEEIEERNILGATMRRQPEQGHRVPQPLRGEGGRLLRGHRGGLHPGQGEPGPGDAGAGPAVSGVPL